MKPVSFFSVSTKSSSASSSPAPRASFWLVWVLALVVAALLAPWLSSPPAPPPDQPPPTPQNIWRFLQLHAPHYDLDPRFVLALANAESGLDPYAFNRGARGLFQLHRAAWEAVSAEPFHEAWNWQKNTLAALAYLAWCRDTLAQHHTVSPPLLAAAFHFGPELLASADFDLRDFRPPNDLYRQILAGNLGAIPAPSG